jgi:Trypsin-like peptidase domain
MSRRTMPAIAVIFLVLLMTAQRMRPQETKPSSTVTSPARSQAQVQEILNKYSMEDLKAILNSRGNKALYDSNHSELKDVSSAAIVDNIISRQKSIYGSNGTDRRRDFWEVQDPKQLTVANSVAALIRPDHYKETQTGLVLSGASLGEKMQLCSDQNYFDQPVIAYCTAFVVGSDLVATAGHCAGTDISSGVRIVFGYRKTRTADRFHTDTEIPKRDVFKVIEVVSEKVEAKGVDYAILRVDRPIKDHLPLPLESDNPVQVGEQLYVLGFPSGLPMKLADQGFVREVSENGYFVSNLDTFGGNSGSPVLRSDSLTVEGILVRGDTDYERRDYCNVAFVCPSETGCRGEDSTLIASVAGIVGTTTKAAQTKFPITKVFSSPPEPSGVGAAFSPEYTVTSEPPPPGYKIAHFEYSLTGDRTCNRWSTCKAVIEGDRAVFRFTLQGHQEWLGIFSNQSGGPGLQPGQAASQGHLVVTYAQD